MENSEQKHSFGLLGRDITYSFSKGYFKDFFKKEGIHNATYENFDLRDISDLETILKEYPELRGLNVTIPYKEEIIPYLHTLDPEAATIGAVNTIKFTNGFRRSLEPFLVKQSHKHALILGTGGASKAIAYTLQQLGINYHFVSRNPENEQWGYQMLNQKQMEQHTLIINCTPLGTYPRLTEKPSIPYAFIGVDHLMYDLVYNPEKSAFLQEGEQRGATICNGLPMLQYQAQKAWEIWQE
ncbi:shikimate dehydrogenase [uncultured Muriicola sp.]|uniref:shikimate dehydrogenase family protein n=1 Tax=uncultured Muriicola sp. TaxID=1583102 RepID=UPI0026384A9E|nr:shikimate dehydrogenase [uncultured Muriicola sp.]